MNFSTTFKDPENGKLKLHKAFSQIKEKKQFSFLSSSHQNYRLIDGSNGQKLRAYKRRITDQQKQQQAFQWRAQTPKPVVKVFHIQKLKFDNQSQNASSTSQIYTQHITTTFDQIKDLSLTQTLYLLKKTISGFQAILKNFGYVSLDQKTCGITAKGDCKVWINDDLSQNKGGMRPKLQQQSQILSQILKIIKKCSSNQCQGFFCHLVKCIPSFEKLKFRLLDEVITNYCNRTQITIPLYLKYYCEVSEKNLTNSTMTSLNRTMDVGKNKVLKSYSNYSNQNKSNIKYRGSDASFSNANLLKPLQQRTSMFESQNLWKIKSNNHQDYYNNDKNSISSIGDNNFLRSTYNGSQRSSNNYLKIQTKSSNSYSDKNKNLLPSCQQIDLQIIPSINNIRGSQKGQKRELPNDMLNSFHNDLVSLNNILTSIKEKDETNNDLVESDHIIENTVKEISIPSSNQITKSKTKAKNKNRICHQFCINLIYEKMVSSVLSSSNSNQLKTSFATTIKTTPYGRTSFSGNFNPFTSQTKTPRISVNYLEKPRNYKNSAIKTSYNDESLFDQGNVSPRFSCEQIKMNDDSKKFFESNILKEKRNTAQNSCYCVKEVQSSTYIPYESEDSITQQSKQNQNVVYMKLEQEKRLNKKRRNSRLVRELMQTQQQLKIDEILMDQQQKKILTANNWTKVVNGLIQSQNELMMNQSVCIDVPGELKKKQSLVKFEKLDKFGKGLTESIVHEAN